MRVLVYYLREKLFTYSALARYEHRKLGIGYLYRYINSSIEQRRIAYYIEFLLDSLYLICIHHSIANMK